MTEDELRDRFDHILDRWPEHNRFDEHEAVLDELMAAVADLFPKPNP